MKTNEQYTLWYQLVANVPLLTTLLDSDPDRVERISKQISVVIDQQLRGVRTSYKPSKDYQT